jgi:hypothetical protein
MVWLVPFAVAAAAVALIVASVLRRRFKPEAHQPWDVGVTLSVLPSRTAVVMLDLGADPASAEVAPLVEHAVREAFMFEAVDVVEVRGRDGQLLDRPCREDVIRA